MRVVENLKQVLSDEQACLLSGDYSRLTELAVKKAELAAQLGTAHDSADRQAVGRIAEMAAHNEALLKSAQRGIQAAILQLKQFTNGEHQSTYSRGGQRRPLSHDPSSIVQKL